LNYIFGTFYAHILKSEKLTLRSKNMTHIKIYLKILILVPLMISCGGSSELDEAKDPEVSPSESIQNEPEIPLQGLDFVQKARWFMSEDSYKEYLGLHVNDEKRMWIGEKINVTQTTQINRVTVYSVFAQFSNQNPDILKNLILVVPSKFEGQKIKSMSWILDKQSQMTPILADHLQKEENWVIRLAPSIIFQSILKEESNTVFQIILNIETDLGLQKIILEINLIKPIYSFNISTQVEPIPLSAEALAFNNIPKNGLLVFKTLIENPNNEELFFNLHWRFEPNLETHLREVRLQTNPTSQPTPLPDAYYRHYTSYYFKNYQVVRRPEAEPYFEALSPYLGDQTPLIKIEPKESIHLNWYVHYLEDEQKCLRPKPYGPEVFTET